MGEKGRNKTISRLRPYCHVLMQRLGATKTGVEGRPSVLGHINWWSCKQASASRKKHASASCRMRGLDVRVQTKSKLTDLWSHNTKNQLGSDRNVFCHAGVSAPTWTSRFIKVRPPGRSNTASAHCKCLKTWLMSPTAPVTLSTRTVMTPIRATVK